MLILTTIFYFSVGYLGILKLTKANSKKELIIYTIFLTFSFVISVLLILGITPFNPSIFIEKIVTSITGE